MTTNKSEATQQCISTNAEKGQQQLRSVWCIFCDRYRDPARAERRPRQHRRHHHAHLPSYGPPVRACVRASERCDARSRVACVPACVRARAKCNWTPRARWQHAREQLTLARMGLLLGCVRLLRSRVLFRWCVRAIDGCVCRYGIGREECFYEEYGLLVPAFLALPALFALTVALNWMVHHATALCYPMEKQIPRASCACGRRSEQFIGS